MAKLFQKSTFLFVLLGLLVLTKGQVLAGKKAAIAASSAASSVTSTVTTTKVANGAAATEKACPCNDKFTEFMNKMVLLLRYYTSQELGPELQALAVKFVEFFFSHLAAEKPEAMNKLHGFLQDSVKVTGAAVAKAAAA